MTEINKPETTIEIIAASEGRELGDGETNIVLPPEPGPPAANIIVFPLIYDEEDNSGLFPLTRQGNAPWITPEGMVGDAYGARYVSTTLPTWVSTASTLSVQATALAEGWYDNPTTIFEFVNGNGDPFARVGVQQDVEDEDSGNLIFQAYDTSINTLRLARLQWKFFSQIPILSQDGFDARPQGFLFMDADTFLVTAHYENQFSLVFQMRVSDGAVLNMFKVGSEIGFANSHIGSIARRSDGQYWFSENINRTLYEVDLAASFSSGNMVWTNTYDASALVSTSSIAWAEISGTEYLLIGEYLESPTPYLYVINTLEVGNDDVFVPGDETKRFIIQERVQGVVYNTTDDLLYISVNRFTGQDPVAPGTIYTIDIIDALANVPTGGATPILNDWSGASRYVEDIDFNPSTNEIWIPTEGLAAVGSNDGFMSIWHRPLTIGPAQDFQENTITAEYSVGGDINIFLNGKTFETIPLANPLVVPSRISIGGGISAPQGQDSTYFSGHVRNIALVEAEIIPSFYDPIYSGSYETGTLLEITLPMVNPGAEAGDTSGWTDEVGAIAARSVSSRIPFGIFYFDGGVVAQSIASQRFSILNETGLDQSEINELISTNSTWVIQRWQQKSFTSGDDSGAGGIRFLDGASVELGETFSPNIVTEPRFTRWIHRAFSENLILQSEFIDTVIQMDRVDGTNNDGYFDNIDNKIYIKEGVAPPPVANIDLMIFGASIVLDIFAYTVDTIDMFALYGVAATVNVDYANDTQLSSDYVAKVGDAIDDALLLDDPYFIMHGATRDARLNAPYPGGAATLDTNMRDVVTQINNSGIPLMYSNLSYFQPPDEVMDDYNQGTINPIISDLNPEFYVSSAPFFNLYNLMFNNQHYLLDGRHPTQIGQAVARSYATQTLIRQATGNTTPVPASGYAGKTITLSMGNTRSNFEGINAAIRNEVSGATGNGGCWVIPILRATDGTLMYGAEFRLEDVGAFNQAGEGNPGNTTPTIENHILLSQSCFLDTTPQGSVPRIRIMGLPNGLTGTMQITSSRSGDTFTRVAEMTYDGNTQTLDSAELPPPIATWAFTVTNNRIEVDWETIANFSYLNGIQLDFD